MKQWRVTYTDKNESRYATSTTVQAETIRGAVSRFERDNFTVVTDRFMGKADTHRGTAYSPTRTYHVEQIL